MEKLDPIEAYTKDDIVVVMLHGDLSYKNGTFEFRKMMRIAMEEGFKKFFVHFGRGMGAKSIDYHFQGELIYHTNAITKLEGGCFILINPSDEVRASLMANVREDLFVFGIDDGFVGRY